MTLTLSNARLRQVLAAHGWQVPPGGIALCGIRGAVPVSPDQIQVTENRLDAYNDTILCFGSAFALWRGSVDPGAYYTQHPLNADGVAHLVNGRWKFKPGWHRPSKYGQTKPCLVQAESFRIWRDRDRTAVRVPHDPEQAGDFGIHLHAGGHGDSVGPNSAGCQIVHGGWDGEPYRQFLGLFWESSLSRVAAYHLLDAADYARLLG